MDYYYKEFDKLHEELHEVMHDYPLFSEMVDKIEEKDIKEINELLSKNDEFYLKSAISKLKTLINYIKDTNKTIKNEFDKFDKSALIWEKINILNVSNEELDSINNQVKRANELIKSHNIKDLVEANNIMESLIRRVNK